MADNIACEEINSTVSCDICGIEYTEEDKEISVILDCDHTFCFTCVESLFDMNYDCPKCSQSLEIEPTDFPINFSLHEASDIFQFLRDFTIGHVNSINDLVERLEICAEKFKSEDMKNEIVNILTEMKQKYRDVEKATDKCRRYPEQILLGKSNFRFYIKSVARLLQNNEKVFVTTCVEDMKYGRVSLWNNMILFHSLCLPDIPPDSYMVLVKDLISPPKREHDLVFLNLSYNKHGQTGIMILEVPLSNLGERFIFNCLGVKYNTSYKNLTYTKGETTEIYDVVVKVVLPDSDDYEFTVAPHGKNNLNNMSDFFLDEMVIQMDRSGNFIIIRTNNYFAKTRFTARVQNPNTFNNIFDYTDESMLKIVDCGVAIKY